MPAHLACKNGNLAVLKCLIENKANLNLKTIIKVFYAIFYCYPEIVNFLFNQKNTIE
ncbi:hypothetical protein GF322_04930 [Candidatus Dependentiae bacterium]|nr:hypothetical protein [Candidatus Dependentiae bacterium]